MSHKIFTLDYLTETQIDQVYLNSSNLKYVDHDSILMQFILPFGVAQWFGLGTSMLEVSSSKPLASESKGFAFWVELVAPGLPSAGYLSYVVCELLHRSGGFTLCAPKG